MRAAYMPFTYIPEPAARRLARLAGPVVVYQPLAANVPPGMTALSKDGLLDLRAPIAGEDARMRAAMAEFLEWGRSNPGRSTAGADFLGARQGEIPFFDETAVNRIRSDIRRFQSTGQPADPTEAAFSLRLFLALAQDNDMAADRLDQDLIRINALEKDFLETLNDADDAAFSRRGVGSGLWREDPGARLTAQRIRAWAGLAAADEDLPQWLLTTSPAVMAAVLEAHANDCPIEKVAHTRLSVPFEDGPPILGEALEAMAIAESISAVDLSAFHLPTADGTDASVIEVSLYAASDRTPADVLRRMAPKSVPAPASADRPASVRHTLLALVGI